MKTTSLFHFLAVVFFAVSLAPWAQAGDQFASATVINGPGTYEESNLGYTAEAGEPAFVAGGSTAWWKFNPAADGFMYVEASIDFNITIDVPVKLGVYTGTALNALTPVLEDSEGRESWRNYADGGFAYEAGTTYYIAVTNTTPGEEGDVTLVLTQGGVPAAGALPVMIYNTREVMTAEGAAEEWDALSNQWIFRWRKRSTQTAHGYLIRGRTEDTVIEDTGSGALETGPGAYIAFWSEKVGKVTSKYYQVVLGDVDSLSGQLIRINKTATGVRETLMGGVGLGMPGEVGIVFADLRGVAKRKKIAPQSAEAVWFASLLKTSGLSVLGTPMLGDITSSYGPNPEPTVRDSLIFSAPSSQAQGQLMIGEYRKASTTVIFNAPLTKSVYGKSLSEAVDHVVLRLQSKGYTLDVP